VNAGRIAGVETDELGADPVAVLLDIEVGDEVVVADVAFWWRVPSLCHLTEVFFQVGDDVLETGHLGGMLRGTGLDGKGEAVDKLPKLLGGDVGVSVKSGED